MTKENVKDYLPLIQALANGETLQFKDSYKGSGWTDLHSFNFACPPTYYRIKPKEPRKFWINIYSNNAEVSPMIVSIVYKTKEEAEAKSTPDRLECIEVMEILK